MSLVVVGLLAFLAGFFTSVLLGSLVYAWTCLRSGARDEDLLSGSAGEADEEATAVVPFGQPGGGREADPAPAPAVGPRSTARLADDRHADEEMGGWSDKETWECSLNVPSARQPTFAARVRRASSRLLLRSVSAASAQQSEGGACVPGPFTSPVPAAP